MMNQPDTKKGNQQPAKMYVVWDPLWTKVVNKITLKKKKKRDVSTTKHQRTKESEIRKQPNSYSSLRKSGQPYSDPP